MELPVPEPFLRDSHRDGANNTDEQDEKDAANVHQAELIHRGPGIFVLKWKLLKRILRSNFTSHPDLTRIQVCFELKRVTVTCVRGFVKNVLNIPSSCQGKMATAVASGTLREHFTKLLHKLPPHVIISSIERSWSHVTARSAAPLPFPPFFLEFHDYSILVQLDDGAAKCRTQWRPWRGFIRCIRWA